MHMPTDWPTRARRTRRAPRWLTPVTRDTNSGPTRTGTRFQSNACRASTGPWARTRARWVSALNVEIHRRFKWEFWRNTQLPRARPANFHPCPTLLIAEGPFLKPVRKKILVHFTGNVGWCLQRHYSFQPNPGPTASFTMKPLPTSPSSVAPVLITWAAIIRFQVRRI